MLNAKQERKRAPKGNGRKNYSKKPARMPLHHGCLMPNEQKKDHPKSNGRNNYSKKPARMPLHRGCLMLNEQKKENTERQWMKEL